MAKKKAILFVDDDPQEINRFNKFLGARYTIAAGSSLELAKETLKGGKPDLILLDLYHGRELTPAESHQAGISDEALVEHERYVAALFRRLGQVADFGRADGARRMFGDTACAFFSRKAFLSDALEAHKKQLSVLEKPDPDRLAISPQAEAAIATFERTLSALSGVKKISAAAYDEAFERKAPELIEAFDDLISQNSWFERWRERLSGLFLFIAAFTAERSYGFWHDTDFWLAAATTALTLALVYGWWAFWRTTG